MLQVGYSCWDGSGHRKSTPIGCFLELVKAQLIPYFHEVRSTNPDDLVYVMRHTDFVSLHVSAGTGQHCSR
jgi:hypothetical protein